MSFIRHVHWLEGKTSIGESAVRGNTICMAITKNSSNASTSKILSSQWGGLSQHLIARFYPLKKLAEGSGWTQSRDKREISTADRYIIDDGFEVHAPITDGASEMTLSWDSPFENSGSFNFAATLTRMLQSGMVTPMVQAVADRFGHDTAGINKVDPSVKTISRRI